MWEKFISILQDILMVYEEILALSKRKHTVLLAVDMTEFETILREERMLIAAVEKLERQRKILLQELIKQEKISAPQQKILDLVAVCGVKQGTEITRIKQRLQLIIAKIEQNGRTNTLLAQQALAVLNYKLNVLSAVSIAPTYASAGQEQLSATKWFEFKA